LAGQSRKKKDIASARDKIKEKQGAAAFRLSPNPAVGAGATFCPWRNDAVLYRILVMDLVIGAAGPVEKISRGALRHGAHHQRHSHYANQQFAEEWVSFHFNIFHIII